jgi:flavin-dependent dehydrogenase
MAEKYDIIVVGAGPAGSLYALLTAQCGLKVLLLDRERFPRTRICGGCLHPAVSTLWKRVGLEESFRKLPQTAVESFMLSNDDRPPIHAAFPSVGETHVAVSRSELDHWLLNEAVAAGAHLLEGVSVRSFEERRVLITSEGDFRSELFIGADGRKSWMARSAGLARRMGSCNRIAWYSEVPEENAPENAVHLKFFPEGYFGINRTGTGTANLSMLLSRRSLDTPQMIVGRYFDDFPPLGWTSTFPISRPRNLPAENRVLLVGDAARLLEPFTGEGIAMALYSSYEAAQLTLATRTSDNTFPGLEKAYCARHRGLYNRMKYHNALSRWLALDPMRGITIVNFLHRFPWLLRFVVRDFHPGATSL